MFKSVKAITLVALIITIIILLVLAGVTINIVLGDNGLFNKARTSVGKYENAKEKENTMLQEYENNIESVYDDALKIFKMSLEEDNIELEYKSSYKLKLKTTKEIADNEISYYSSDDSIASVDKTGLITAKDAGTAIITIKKDEYSIQCTVTIKDYFDKSNTELDEMFSNSSKVSEILNDAKLIDKVCSSSKYKQLMYKYKSVWEPLIKNSATAKTIIKSHSTIAYVNGNAETNNVYKTIYNRNCFVLGFSQNGIHNAGSYYGTVTLTLNSTNYTWAASDCYGTNGNVCSICAFGSIAKAKRSEYSSSGHGKFNYYITVLDCN